MKPKKSVLMTGSDAGLFIQCLDPDPLFLLIFLSGLPSNQYSRHRFYSNQKTVSFKYNFLIHGVINFWRVRLQMVLDKSGLKPKDSFST
jgi:hypothetical protein